jgi:transcriptional regulator with XRE-family HTH domain
MAKVSPVEIQNKVREAIARDERPQQEIARAAGIHYVNLSQFKAGARSLPLDTLCKLAEVVGLEITVKKLRRL